MSTNTRLCKRLLEETGAALLPGSSFGMQSQALTARLAYVGFDGQAALKALANNAFRADDYAEKTLLGIAAISSWLRNC